MMTEWPIKSKRAFMVLPRWIKRGYRHAWRQAVAIVGSSQPDDRPLRRPLDLDLSPSTLTYNAVVVHGHSCKSRTGRAWRAPTHGPRTPLPRARAPGDRRRHARRRAAALGSARAQRPRRSAVHLLPHSGRAGRLAIEPRSRLLERR